MGAASGVGSEVIAIGVGPSCAMLLEEEVVPGLSKKPQSASENAMSMSKASISMPLELVPNALEVSNALLVFVSKLTDALMLPEASNEVGAVAKDGAGGAGATTVAGVLFSAVVSMPTSSNMLKSMEPK